MVQLETSLLVAALVLRSSSPEDDGPGVGPADFDLLVQGLVLVVVDAVTDARALDLVLPLGVASATGGLGASVKR